MNYCSSARNSALLKRTMQVPVPLNCPLGLVTVFVVNFFYFVVSAVVVHAFVHLCTLGVKLLESRRRRGAANRQVGKQVEIKTYCQNHQIFGTLGRGACCSSLILQRQQQYGGSGPYGDKVSADATVVLMKVRRRSLSDYLSVAYLKEITSRHFSSLFGLPC